MFAADVACACTIGQWLEKFQSGDVSLESQLWRDEMKVSKDELETVVKAITSQTTHELTGRFGVSLLSILEHLKQIGMVK